ncbi:MAG: sodium-dependent transporter [Candidatus Njordarchaeales archaeon]
MLERETWKSKIGAAFAFMAATIGLGSLWRFPYKVGVFGGAAFLLIYFLAYILIGIPAYNAETLLGKRTRKGPAGAFELAAREVGASYKWRYLGDATVILGTLLNTQYLVVVGWTIVYFYLSLTGKIFTTDIQRLESIWRSVFPGYLSVIGLGIATIYCTYFIIKGVSRGIEKVTQILMPALFIILLIGVVRSLTLPNASEGIIFLFMPHIEALADPVVWLQALGQVYFTTALGIGFIITYGSYMAKDQNIEYNTYLVAFGDNLASILAGLAIFPAVFAFGFHPAAGPQLAFIVLPQVFAKMPLGYIFGVLFFLSFAIAALECTKAAFEVATAYLIDEFGVERRKAAIFVGAVQFLIGIGSALSYDVWMLFDWLWTIIPPLIGLFTSIFVAWIWKAERFAEEEKIREIWFLLLKYIVPIGILIIFLGYLTQFFQIYLIR